jgi:integrase
MATLRKFLRKNKIVLEDDIWEDMIGRCARPASQDTPPTTAELRSILQHMKPKGKAFTLIEATSGLRGGELLQIRMADVELERDPAVIIIPGAMTKNGAPRITFMSSEARDATMEWLKVRPGCLGTSVKRTWKYHKNAQDDRLFPFSSDMMREIYNQALECAGMGKRDLATGRHIMHEHTLRKFFKSKMTGAGVPDEIVAFMMGHEGYVKGAYDRYTAAELTEFYKKGEPALTIFSDPKELIETKAQLADTKEQLQDMINGLMGKNLKIEAQLEDLQGWIEQISDQIQFKAKP